MPKIRKDWRNARYREELFMRYAAWRLKVHDLDHSHYCKHLTKDMSKEEAAWFAILFGMTYRTPQAYAYWWHWHRVEDIKLADAEQWNSDNWKRTTYGTDARYNKGHWYNQTESIVNWLDGRCLYSTLVELCQNSTEVENFYAVFDTICGFYKFGRMTAWLACQALYDTTDLPIQPNRVLLRNPKSDSSMQSIWNGYWTLRNRPEMMLGKQYGSTKVKITKVLLDTTNTAIMRYKDKVEKFVGAEVDMFKWESIWCQFKRLFHTGESKEYPGHASGDAASRYLYYKEHWPEVDWYKFRQGLLTQPSMIAGMTYVRQHNAIFGKTGHLLNIHEMYDDIENGYECLGIDPNQFLIEQLFIDHNKKVPSL